MKKIASLVLISALACGGLTACSSSSNSSSPAASAEASQSASPEPTKPISLIPEVAVSETVDPEVFSKALDEADKKFPYRSLTMDQSIAGEQGGNTVLQAHMIAQGERNIASLDSHYTYTLEVTVIGITQNEEGEYVTIDGQRYKRNGEDNSWSADEDSDTPSSAVGSEGLRKATSITFLGVDGDQRKYEVNLTEIDGMPQSDEEVPAIATVWVDENDVITRLELNGQGTSDGTTTTVGITYTQSILEKQPEISLNM
ncbi:hypothetical protein [Actinomyces vulturis]|uniref:hypothetical protein n=1 Tax=Actinomyces vulturis TaxID=1857645 RepID=UPI000833AA86|nr:hypothetical protein [Actinomyces vulturis]